MLYREKTSYRLRKKMLMLGITLLAAAAIICGAKLVGSGIKKDISTQTLASIKNAVLRSAVQCYAVEGSYPQSLDYLEQNYGLQLNHKQYFVDYQIFASNVMPDVAVLIR